MMNVFFLHRDPEVCAQYHCDQHVGNQLREYAQILSTAAEMNDVHEDWMYKPIPNNNPPLMRWAAECRGNALWLMELGNQLHQEWDKRYGGSHKSWREVGGHFAPVIATFDRGWFEHPPLSGARDRHETPSPVVTHRNFYVDDKRDFATWEYTQTPAWWTAKIGGDDDG